MKNKLRRVAPTSRYRVSAALMLSLLSLSFLLATAGEAYAQQERNVEPPERQYGEKFFTQLRSLFGRFREAELDRAFEAAEPIQCSELISGDGEWRPVAFFNEDRSLGDWYHGSLDEVKTELSIYIFKGVCRSEQSGVQLVTKFPVGDSIDAYNARRIPVDEIRVNVNAAVAASFNPQAQIYTFELPYLYADRVRNTRDTVYSLVAPHLEDRYATDVTNHWECKSVRARDVTFQFLICRTWTLPRDAAARRQSRPSFGSSAYFILSDGREASTTVKLSFGGGDTGTPATEVRSEVPPDRTLAPLTGDVTAAAASVSDWAIPETDSKLMDVERREFRVRFSTQTWTNKIGSPQVLVDQKMVALAAANPTSGADYCVWQPASPTLAPRALGNEPDTDIDYNLTTNSGDRQSSISISFELKTHNGSRVGTLQCFFPKANAANNVSFERWVAVVGAHLAIETRP